VCCLMSYMLEQRCGVRMTTRYPQCRVGRRPKANGHNLLHELTCSPGTDVHGNRHARVCLSGMRECVCVKHS
jgi:hypothetical protein